MLDFCPVSPFLSGSALSLSSWPVITRSSAVVTGKLFAKW